MNVVTTQRLNYWGQESKIHDLHLIFVTLVNMKQSQGNETYNDTVDPIRCCNHAKNERSGFNGVREKANIECFVFLFFFCFDIFNLFSNKEICQLSPSNMRANKAYS